MKKITIKVDFLAVTIEVRIVKWGQISKERQKVGKAYPKLPVFADDPHCGGLHTSFYEHYQGKTWLFLEKGCPIGSANHEIQHAVDYIGKYFNIQDTEFRAYLFEYITGKIMPSKTIG